MAISPQRHLGVVSDAPISQENITSATRALLDIAGIHQRDLARQIGLAPSALSKMLNGTRRVSIEETGRIASALRVPVTVLFEGAEPIRQRAFDAAATGRDSGRDPDGGIPARAALYAPWDLNPEPAD